MNDDDKDYSVKDRLKSMEASIKELLNLWGTFATRIDHAQGVIEIEVTSLKENMAAIKEKVTATAEWAREADYRLKNGCKHFEKVDKTHEIFDGRINELEKEFRPNRCSEHSGLLKTLNESYLINKGKWLMVAQLIASLASLAAVMALVLK